jgi:putative ABC transport system permease protein
MVMRQGLVLVLGGIMTGLCVALILTRSLENVLYKTTSRDLTTFVLAPALFLLVAVVATYLPARRAMNVEPAETLR